MTTAYKHDDQQQKLFDATYDWTNQCVQCGYCLPACPTYQSMGKESASPRGRINLVKMAAEGKIDIQSDLSGPIDYCLGCRACEVACPVDVPYGHILEATKQVIADSKDKNDKKQVDTIKSMALRRLFPYPKRMAAFGNLFWLYQRTGLNKLVRKTKMLSKMSEPLVQMEPIIPPVESPFKRCKGGTVYRPIGENRRIRVAFFKGCIMDAVMSRINRLTIELLRSVGCEVVVPKTQNCCGALHAHQGETGKAKELAKANIAAFQESGADFFVNNAGGCGATLVEYDHLLSDEKEWAEAARSFVRKSKDISQILFEYGPLPFKKEWEGIITYQDSCHLRNVQKVHCEPRALLHSIPGATFIEMESADSCCASGGIYNILHFDESNKILDEKMKKVKQTQAVAVITANPGCQLQMSLGIKREGLTGQIRSMHLVELLAETCGLE